MKKLFLAMLAGLTVMAMAYTASAEVTVGGQIEIRYDLWQNIDLNEHAANFETINFFDQRVILNVDAKITEGLEAYIELDTENTPWGLATGLGNLPEYLNHGAAVNVTSSGAFGEDDEGIRLGSVAIRQAWINFMIPGLPVGVKIGHQPLALGHGIWLDTHRRGSDAILLYSKPIPELLLAAAYVQGSQSLPTEPTYAGTFGRLNGGLNFDVLGNPPVFSFKNDADFYAVLANFTWMENNTVGINFTYVDDHDSLEASGLGSLPIWATNVALVADGTIAGLSYKGEVDWLYVNTSDLFGTDDDYLISAWAAMIGVNYNVMDMANVGVEVAYGTGNDDNRPAIFYDPGGEQAISGGPVNTRKDTAYYTPYNSTSYDYAFLYNDKIGQGPFGSGGGFGFGDGFGGIGLANTGYVKVSAEVTPMEKLKAGLDILYLRASETMIAGQDRDLGWEIDAHVNYDLYDNLALEINGGYFITGDWYKFHNHVAVIPALADTLEDPTDLTSDLDTEDSWGLETKLTVKF